MKPTLGLELGQGLAAFGNEWLFNRIFVPNYTAASFHNGCISMRDGTPPRPHPRTMGWVGATALAMGGSNQSLFLMAALFVGQGNIPGQGSAAVPLLVFGLLLSFAAAPAWTELVLMWPNRVGGISSACAEAFRPYSPVLSALTGTCYWWGWVPTCGLTAILSASAIQQWYLPAIPVEAVACGLIAVFTAVNLCGIKWVTRLAIPIATASALLAFLSSLIPVLSGSVDWRQATDFTLTSPFEGWFGDVTSLMAGLYLIGFAAPAFEAAACHVGETINPNRNIPRAMLASAAMAGIYFLVLPVVWLGVLGPEPLGTDLAVVLGPTFAPLLGSFGKAAAIWFIMLNMFHGTLQPLAGAARTLAQLSEDGLLPRFLAMRTAITDCPWAATLLTATAAILFMLFGYVRTVLGLGSKLNIPVIAEGVETEDERLFLMKEGCAEVQGFLVGRPMPIASYAALTSGISPRVVDWRKRSDSPSNSRKSVRVIA
jgi:amino acid transporter